MQQPELPERNPQDVSHRMRSALRGDKGPVSRASAPGDLKNPWLYRSSATMKIFSDQKRLQIRKSRHAHEHQGAK